MGDEVFVSIAREGLYLVLLLSAPPVLAVLVVGLVSSLLQALTQVHEVAIGFVPKLIAAFVALAVAGPWIGQHLIRFTYALYEGIRHVGP